MDPPVKTARAQSKLFTVQCCQWEPKADGPPHLLSIDALHTGTLNQFSC